MIDGRDWLKAVMADSKLPGRAKAVAWALEDQRNNSKGLCFPKAKTLAAMTSLSSASVDRAVRELDDAGYIGRSEGRGRGNHTRYSFLCRGKVVALNPRKKPINPEISKRENPSERMLKPINPEISYYKDDPSNDPSNSASARERLTGSHCPVRQAALVKAGSHREEAWNDWLRIRGWPKLSELGVRFSDATGVGWQMPFSLPPRDDDKIELLITEKYLSWASSRLVERRMAAI